MNRKECLYELTFCDILLIQRGYERRQRYLWSAVRWQTYHTMLSTCGSRMPASFMALLPQVESMVW